MNNPNAALALQLAIDLITQALKIQQVLQAAQLENRDISAAELDVASTEADQSLTRLRTTISSMG